MSDQKPVEKIDPMGQGVPLHDEDEDVLDDDGYAGDD